MTATQRSWEAPCGVCPECGEPFWDPEVTHCPDDGSRLISGSDGPNTMVERVVGGRYRLLGLLGEGGMGTVYAGEHAVSLRRVALKIIKPELESSSVARGRFLRECQLLERIDSPYVVQVLESGESKSGEIYLVMELLEGMTLGDRIDSKGAIPADEAVRIAIQIAHALAAAQDEGIVHRDLKPDNVFLCEDGSVRVLDFGIARLLDGVTLDASSRKLTATGTIVGTPAYISPEGAAGALTGPAADVYSLGVLLYEMIAGELPFWDSHPVLLMGMHLKEPPPRLDNRDFSLPKDLVELVDQMLRKKPEERPATADEVLSRLQGLQDVDGTLIKNALDTFPSLEQPPRSSARLGIALGLLAAVMALLLGGAWWALSEDTTPVELTPEPPSTASASGVDPEPPEGASPTGTTAAADSESDPPAPDEDAPAGGAEGAGGGERAGASTSTAGRSGQTSTPAEPSTATDPEAESEPPRRRRRAGGHPRRGRRQGAAPATSPSETGGRRRRGTRDSNDMIRDYW